MAWCGKGAALVDRGAMPSEEMQKVLGKQLFDDTAQWRDSGWSKRTSRHPNCKFKEFKVPLWLNSLHKPVWVYSQSATMDAGLKATFETGCTVPQWPGVFAAAEGSVEVDMCRKLCEHGLLSNAVDALDLLVQRRCRVPSNLFYQGIRRCIQDKNLSLGKRIHTLTVRSGYKGDAFLATHLICLYAMNGRLEEARGVFAEILTPDAYNWSAIISAYARHGSAREATEAIHLYRQMCKSTTVEPDDRLYSAVLKACAAAKDLAAGKDVHAHILARGREPDSFVQSGLVNMYAKCGTLDDARRLFDKVLGRDIVTWNAMITGYAQQGKGQEAVHLYRSMLQEGLIRPNYVTFVCMLQACASIGRAALDEGKQLHSDIKGRGLQVDVILGGSLVNMYAKCGSLADARLMFDQLAERNVVAWNAMIAGYAQQGIGQEVLTLYRSMRQEGLKPDGFTYVSLLQACACLGSEVLEEGKRLHAEIGKDGLEEDLVLSGSLVNMYAKCGSLDYARRLFDKIPARNIVAWNAMIAGYAQNEMGWEALDLYKSMQLEGFTPDSVTYVCLLQACASIGVGALGAGKHLHAQIEETGLARDAVLGSILVSMYAKCGSIEEARTVFDKLLCKDVVTWTAMISGYGQQGMGNEALALYRGMQQEGLTPPNSVTFVCLLQACASVGAAALADGKELHAQVQKRGLEEEGVLGVSLVNMYAKCCSLEDARTVFDKLPERNVVAWTTIIAGYTLQGMGQEALSLYTMMQQEGLCPNPVTYVCLLQACAAVAALPLGEQLHAEIRDRGLQDDGVLGAALVNMYAKCGSMYDSQRVFDSLSERSVEAWGALLGGYARHGDSQIVFDLVERMESDGIHPDEITFLSVLTVCSHGGLVDEGRKYFNAMSDFGVNVTMDHLICMVDLLGRAGHLDEALQMAKNMPFPSNHVVWHTLLGACRKWKNVEIGQQAFEGAVSLDEKDAVSYVAMSSIYASNQMWDAAKEVQARRMKLGAWKTPGQSWWIDMGGVVHTFLVGDKRHPESQGIYARLEQLIPRMRKEGYVPVLEASLLGTTSDEKQTLLCGHSEKLAIAYALNKTLEGTTIRIVKNLRVCEDCHTATAYISKVERRTIICRDSSRFHVFSDGQCSCGNFW